MTRAVNIYALSRIKDEDDFNIVKKHRSQHDDKRRTQYHEMESLRLTVDALSERGITVSELEGFFFGYSISRIGKEFDLLKITDKYCLNIELKSMEVPKEQILEQLRRNRYYLNLLGRRQELFTVVTDTMSCYKLTLSDELTESSMDEIASAVMRASDGWLPEIDSLFRPSNYLVSPMNTPERFIQREYFLTQAQDVIKKELMSAAEKSFSGTFFHLTGKPGTGKTLLLYDISRAFSKYGRTLIVHCGELHKGQVKISEEVENLEIVSSEDIASGLLEGAHFILVDESQRMDPELFEEIVRSVRKNGQICVFSSDPHQVLTPAEMENDISGRIGQLEPLAEFKLSERIRTNREIYSFILKMMHLTGSRGSYADYGDVRVDYAGNEEEKEKLLGYYRSSGYVFIGYEEGEGDVYAGSVIGQEFDDVVMYLDGNFFYDEDRRLKGRRDIKDVLYPNLFYQGVTRVRERLALVVTENGKLFDSIVRIFGEPYFEEVLPEEGPGLSAGDVTEP